MSGDMMVYESVPRLTRRQGDAVTAGANNATLLLGRDRPGAVDSGYGSGPGAGAASLVVGRAGTDPSIAADAATLYLSAKTDADANAGTTAVGSPQSAVSAAILRADCVRIAPRKDFKVSVGPAFLVIGSDGTIVLEGTSISLGQAAAFSALLAELFAPIFNTHTHLITTPGNPSGTPVPLVTPSLFSTKVKLF